MKIIRIFVGAMGRLMLSLLAADLLYLYYVRAWTDPYPIILVSELILLWSMVLIGIIWCKRYLHQAVFTSRDKDQASSNETAANLEKI